MSWVKERWEARKKAQEEWQTVDLYALKTYEGLWEEILSLVDEAVSLGMPVGTNGSQLERIVYVSVKPKRVSEATNPRELTLAFDRPKHTVTARSDAPAVTLELAVCPDGVVCLKHEGKQISSPEAARLILEPFLFPANAPLF